MVWTVPRYGSGHGPARDRVCRTCYGRQSECRRAASLSTAVWHPLDSGCTRVQAWARCGAGCWDHGEASFVSNTYSAVGDCLKLRGSDVMLEHDVGWARYCSTWSEVGSLSSYCGRGSWGLYLKVAEP